MEAEIFVYIRTNFYVMLAEKSLLEWATLYYNVNVKYVRHAFIDEGTNYRQYPPAQKKDNVI
jgi:hypothetical protein